MPEQLEHLDEKGTPPNSRLKDAAAARNIFHDLERADQVSSSNRALVRAMLDEEPPYDQAELDAAGQSYRCNVNFGEGANVLQSAIGAYVDLVMSPELLAEGITEYLPPETDLAIKTKWERVIFTEFTYLLRKWPGFVTQFLSLMGDYLADGVAFAIFDEVFDWRFRAAGLGQLYFPRKTTPDPNTWTVVFWRQSYSVIEIYTKIRNKDAALTRGWDVKQVELLLSKACCPDNNGTSTTNLDWERVQEDLKNNDLFGEKAVSADIELIHCWVAEFDGQVSHYIFKDTPTLNPTVPGGEPQEGFLFRHLNAFKSFEEIIVPFTYGVGNGYLHSIRGLGHRVFPHNQIHDRMQGQMVDSAMLSSSLMLEPRDESARQEAGLAVYGPFAVVSPGSRVVTTGIPNLGQNVVPVMQEMRESIRKRGMHFTSSDALPGGRELTRYEVSARIQQAGGLSSVSLMLFFPSYARLIQNIFTRVANQDYPLQEGGGKSVTLMREQLEKQGVPLEALYQIKLESVKAAHSMGAGSTAARNESFRELSDLAPGFSEAGRQQLLYDRTASLTGSYDVASRYVKPPEDRTPPPEAKMALLETNQLTQGVEIPVFPDEMHLTHLQVHTQRISEILLQIENGEAEVTAVVAGLNALHAHCIGHLEVVQGDTISQNDVAYFRQALQQSAEAIANGMRALAKEQREGTAAGGQSDEQTLKLQMKAEEHRMKLEMLRETAATKNQLAIQEAETKRLLAQAEAASRLNPVKTATFSN